MPPFGSNVGHTSTFVQELGRPSDAAFAVLCRSDFKEGITLNIRTKAGLALAAAALFILPAANASAALIDTSPCDGATLTQPFADFGDNAFYKIVPGGDFEGSLTGWTLKGGAAKASGSESFNVTGKAGASSLNLPAGASAITPATCVNAGAPTYRFFTKSSGGLLGLLPVMKVDLVYHNLLGLVALPLGTAVPSSNWSSLLALPNLALVSGLIDDGVSDLSLRFTAVTGTWRVDDVFVDPAQRG
jgi:hypothetical protein